MELRFYLLKRNALWAIVVLGLVILLLFKSPFSSRFQELPSAVNWISALVLGVSLISGVVQLFDRRVYFVFTAKGFTHRSISKQEILWDKLEDVELISSDPGMLIYVGIDDDYLRSIKLNPLRNTILGSQKLEFNVAGTGCDARKVLRFMQLMRRATPILRQHFLESANLK